MALPSLAKTWQLNINNVEVSDDNYIWHQKFLFNIKEAMIGFGSNAWTVAGSGDGSGNFNVMPAGPNDYWIAYTDLLWGTGNHAWIVLENVNGVQVCFDLNQTTGNARRMDTYFSPGGLFLGGSNSARPTATDEIDIRLTSETTNYQWMGEETGSTVPNYVWHMWHSTDGEVTRLVAYKNNVAITIMRFEKFKNPRSAHAVPYGCGIYSGRNYTSTKLSVTYQEDNDIMRSDHGGTSLAIFCTGVGRAGSNLVEDTQAPVAEEIDNELWFTEVGYVSDTVGGRGPKGEAFDMWWGQYQVASDGDTYPSTPSARQFVQMGHFVFPWTGDSTIPLTA